MPRTCVWPASRHFDGIAEMFGKWPEHLTTTAKVFLWLAAPLLATEPPIKTFRKLWFKRLLRLVQLFPKFLDQSKSARIKSKKSNNSYNSQTISGSHQLLRDYFSISNAPLDHWVEAAQRKDSEENILFNIRVRDVRHIVTVTAVNLPPVHGYGDVRSRTVSQGEQGSRYIR